MEEVVPHNPLKISGYRSLSENEIRLMNRIKEKEKEVLDLIREMSLAEDLNRRWQAIGKTDIETGFMALVRSVARPNGE